MSAKDQAGAAVDVDQLVADTDLGGRNPGPVVARLLLAVTLAWSLFQLWIASPLPFAPRRQRGQRSRRNARGR